MTQKTYTKRKKKTATRRKRRPAARQRATAPPSRVARLSRALPGTVAKNRYVARTLEILEDREKRTARIRQQTRRRLHGVWSDINQDVSKRVRKTTLGQRVRDVPDRLTTAMDDWLDRVGLVRKRRAA